MDNIPDWQQYSAADQISHGFKTTNETIGKSIGPGALALSLLLGYAAKKGMRAQGPHDKIDGPEIERWGNKYLKSNHVYAFPKPGTDNASYQKIKFHPDGKNKPEQEGHVINYDPTLSKSVGAHEIGHGMKSIPRVPFSSLLAPYLLASGGYEAGVASGLGGGDQVETSAAGGVGKGLLGLGLIAPTLADEWMASKNAKKILKTEGIKPRGLTRAWGTYAAPVGVGALAAGAGYAFGDHYSDRMANEAPDVRFQHQTR